MPKKKPKPFSAGTAVRANARERLGQPKPARAIPEKPVDGDRSGKHKERLAALLAKRDEDATQP